MHSRVARPRDGRPESGMGGVRLFALLLCGSAAQTAQCGSSSSVTLQLEPPELVGHSNQSKTHYWFPTDMAVVFNATHFLLDARLADGSLQ